MSYQFRFGFKEEELNEIFNDSEILEKLNKAILKNEEKVNKFINDVKEEVILLIEKEHEPREDFKNLITDDNKVKEMYTQSVKNRILWLAINDILYSHQFNVKENILRILDSEDLFEIVLKERVVVIFSGLTDYEFLNELETKFL